MSLRFAGRFLFVFVAVGLDALAFVWIVLDAYVWFQTGELEFAPLGVRWHEFDSGSLNLSQAVIQRYVWPPLWDPGITTVLLWPAWLAPLAAGGLLTYLGFRGGGETDASGGAGRGR